MAFSREHGSVGSLNSIRQFTWTLLNEGSHALSAPTLPMRVSWLARVPRGLSQPSSQPRTVSKFHEPTANFWCCARLVATQHYERTRFIVSMCNERTFHIARVGSTYTTVRTGDPVCSLRAAVSYPFFISGLSRTIAARRLLTTNSRDPAAFGKWGRPRVRS
jgi:hypothetical protein